MRWYRSLFYERNGAVSCPMGSGESFGRMNSNHRKGVKHMKYETPELKFVGEAEEVVQGLPSFGGDALGDLDW